jgi:hypothetical protein
MRWLRNAVVVILLGAVVFWGWTRIFPSEKRVIEKRLHEVAELASFKPGENPLAGMFKVERFAGYFSPQVVIVFSGVAPGISEFQGRDEVMQAALGARSQLQGMKVEFLDVTVQLGPGADAAVATLTAKATFHGNRELMVQEFKVSLEKIDSKWLINRVETVKTLL